mgnify:CR=1 FL=1
MRNFKINGVRFCIINRFTGNNEINEYNQKYDVIRFDEKLRGWVRLCSANTLAKAREKAAEWMEN